jgi:transposase InsO family protein
MTRRAFTGQLVTFPMHRFNLVRGDRHGRKRAGKGAAPAGEDPAAPDPPLRTGDEERQSDVPLFGISRGQFYFWLRRYRQVGFPGLRAQKCGPRNHPFKTPPHVVARVLQVRHERQYGPIRICLFRQRYHQTYVSVPTIYKILKRHRVPRVSFKRYRPGPRRRRELAHAGQSVQVDVKHLKLGASRFYQFTAIDEATRYRVLKIYTRNSIPKAIAFIDEVRRRLPVAIQRVQTDHGNEFGTDFTWHLRDLGIAHRHIPPGCPESNGKVERIHRTDEDEFYRGATFRTAAELATKLRRWEHVYNHASTPSPRRKDPRRASV